MQVVATAGHVDHGKSTLVRALTGMEPDRWAEERRRGMTIDLGYAWTQLPSGQEIAFVDVPGHERFIANMLAGLGPAPGVLFVVAADAGWSRQSEEHLRAVDALGVRHGLLVVTRSDLAEPAPAMAQARERIARSSLGRVDAVAASGTLGSGLDDVRVALDRLIDAMPPPDLAVDVRLWIDRCFTVRGSGTVVTATLAGGSVAAGDQLELRGSLVTVRAIKSLGLPHDRVSAPARVALNLRGVARSAISRGDVLLAPRRWHWTDVVDARLDTDAALPGELVLHVGTAAVPVRLRPLDRSLTRLTLAKPLPLRAGDRAVLRDPGRRSVAAGVLILDADPPPLTRRGAAQVRAQQLSSAMGTPDAAAEVQRRGYIERAHLERLGILVSASMDVRAVAGWLVSPEALSGWVAAALPAGRSWAALHPLAPDMPVGALRRALGLPDDAELLADVIRRAGLDTEDGTIRVPAPVDLGPAEKGVAAVVARLASAPFDAPDRDLLRELGLGIRELSAAERAGRLLRVSADIVLLPSAPDLALMLLGQQRQPFTASEARQTLGSTRRVIIPLLEYLDAVGRTQRLDANARRIVPETSGDSVPSAPRVAGAPSELPLSTN